MQRLSTGQLSAIGLFVILVARNSCTYQQPGASPDCVHINTLYLMHSFLCNGFRRTQFSEMRLNIAAFVGLSSSLVVLSSSSAVAQFSAPSGMGDTTAQVRQIIDTVKKIGIVDGKAVAGKTKEACDALAQADPLLKMVNDAEVKKTVSELKEILECS